MQVRQSDLKLWNTCPLKYRWTHVERLPRLQGGSATFGSIIHDVVAWLETHHDLDGALARFARFWNTPTELDPSYGIDYYVRGTTWARFAAEGPRILRDWYSLIAWESDVVLAREYSFDVPIGEGHVLHGTVDKLALRREADGQRTVLLSDYKTNRKLPTYNYLAEDLQFSAYAYASTRPEFWADLPGGRGPALHTELAGAPRRGEWVALTGPKRMDAGLREARHYNRLELAVNALARSVAQAIFVPTISGESCRYCEFRRQCGLPEITEDDQT